MANKTANKYANFTADELKAYEINKKRFFKGTIAVCAVYGAFAALLLLVAFFDSRGRQILTEELLPFVVTFVASMVLIIIFIVVQVLAFKPKKMQADLYDPDSCPDYWKMEETPTNEIPEDASDEEKFLMKYRCVPDTKVYEKKAMWKPVSNRPGALQKLTYNPTDTEYDNAYGQKITKDQYGNAYAYKAIPSIVNNNVRSKLREASKTMYKNFNNNTKVSEENLRCDMVYPAYLAAQDVMNFENRPNTLRCAYASTCSVPWTTICPDKS